MIALLAPLLFAWGHDIRDGTPDLGTTHGARALGALMCGLGADAACGGAGWLSTAICMGIWLGFYTDALHGDGQQARGWRDVPALLCSGVTSLAPAALAAGLAGGWAWALLILAGLAKPPIWFACWRLLPPGRVAWLWPTRAAAVLFGALIGAVVEVLA